MERGKLRVVTVGATVPVADAVVIANDLEIVDLADAQRVHAGHHEHVLAPVFPVKLVHTALVVRPGVLLNGLAREGLQGPVHHGEVWPLRVGVAVQNVLLALPLAGVGQQVRPHPVWQHDGVRIDLQRPVVEVEVAPLDDRPPRLYEQEGVRGGAVRRDAHEVRVHLDVQVGGLVEATHLPVGHDGVAVAGEDPRACLGLHANDHLLVALRPHQGPAVERRPPLRGQAPARGARLLARPGLIVVRVYALGAVLLAHTPELVLQITLVPRLLAASRAAAVFEACRAGVLHPLGHLAAGRPRQRGVRLQLRGHLPERLARPPRAGAALLGAVRQALGPELVLLEALHAHLRAAPRVGALRVALRAPVRHPGGRSLRLLAQRLAIPRAGVLVGLVRHARAARGLAGGETRVLPVARGAGGLAAPGLGAVLAWLGTLGGLAGRPDANGAAAPEAALLVFQVRAWHAVGFAPAVRLVLRIALQAGAVAAPLAYTILLVGSALAHALVHERLG
mmetsp:Transcript_65575/g.182876  ORF Transcript_65575/g.182876 Transcript_65575/m.182876 type:complete len:507 (-) Transcript_65575:607-2127(-)